MGKHKIIHFFQTFEQDESYELLNSLPDGDEGNNAYWDCPFESDDLPAAEQFLAIRKADMEAYLDSDEFRETQFQEEQDYSERFGI